MSLSKKELKDEFKGVLKPAGLNSLYDLLASIDAEQEIVLEPEPVVEGPASVVSWDTSVTTILGDCDALLGDDSLRGAAELFPTATRAKVAIRHMRTMSTAIISTRKLAHARATQIIDADLEKSFYEARRAFHDARDDKRSRKDLSDLEEKYKAAKAAFLKHKRKLRASSDSDSDTDSDSGSDSDDDEPPAKRARGNGLYIPDAKVGKDGSFGKRRAHKVRTKFDSKGRKKSQEVEVQESQTNGFVCRDRKRGRG